MDAEVLVDGLGAVVSRAHGDPGHVQNLAHVVGVHASTAKATVPVRSTASATGWVPASKRSGGGMYVVPSMVTTSTIDPPNW